MSSKLLPNTRTSSNHKFWAEFFMLYKSLPALWNTHCEEYKDRYAKSEACDEMVAKLSEFKPNCNRRDVLRQINIFRTNYRRERSRIEERRLHSKKFHTSLWYYNLLSFLDNHEARGKKKKTVYKVDDEEQDLIVENNDETEQYVLYNELDSTGNSTITTYDSSQENAFNIIENHHCAGIETGENEFYEYIIENEFEAKNQVQELQTKPVVESNYNKSGTVEQFPYESCNKATNLESSHSETNEYASIEYIVTNDEKDLNDDEGSVVLEYETVGHILTNPSDTVNEGTIHNNNISPMVFNTVEHIPLMPLTKKSVKDANTMTDETFSNLSKNSNSSEILAQSWALQYDEMSMQQKIYARRAIADILFAGCMGRLGTHQENLSCGQS